MTTAFKHGLVLDEMRAVDINDILQIVINVTGDSVPVGDMNQHTILLGAIPEIDSMAIINIILALEQRYGIRIDDEEVEQSVFESVGSLLEFTQTKLNRLQSSQGSADHG